MKLKRGFMMNSVGEKKVDIIIPAYNAIATLSRSLDSIVKQTYVNRIKVYVVDDFSVIPYNEIVSKYSDKVDIKLLRLEKNRGPGYARQYGIDNSFSKYIMFLDSDDYITDDVAIEMMIDEMEKYDYDAISTFMSEDVFGKRKDYYVGFDTIHAKLYRRSFLKKYDITFPYYYNSEDVAFNNYVLLNTNKIGRVNVNSYTYHRRNNSLTQDKEYTSDRHVKCLCDNLLFVIEKAERQGVDKNYISSFLCNNLCYFMWYFHGVVTETAVLYLPVLVDYYYKYSDYYVESNGSFWLNYWIIIVKNQYSKEQFMLFLKTIKNKS